MVNYTRKRVDLNQTEIVDYLIDKGCSVTSLAAVGKGVPDLLVGYAGYNFLIEVKNPDVPRRDQRLTPDQVEFHGDWDGNIFVAFYGHEAWSYILDYIKSD